MRWLLPRTLAAKIVLHSVGIAAALALSLTLIGYRKSVQGLGERSAKVLESEATLNASLVDTWARDRLAGLRALANLRPVRRLLETAAAPVEVDLDAADTAMGDAIALAPEIQSVALIDPTGRVVRSTDPAEESQHFERRAYFREALAGRPFISGITASLVPTEPVVFFSVPALGSNGTVIGVARIQVSLAPVRSFVAAARDRGGSGANGLLLDESGLVMANTIDPGWQQRPIAALSAAGERALLDDKRWGTAPAPLPLQNQELAAARGITVATAVRFSLGGAEQLGAAEPLATARWLYVASLPRVEVERTATDLLRNDILAALVGLLAAIGLSLLFARQLVASVMRLTAVSALIVSEGDLTQKLESTSDDEVGQLTRSFARMVEALREALTALKASAKELEEAGNDLHTTMDQQSQLIGQQAAALQETQVTAQEIKQTSKLAAEKAQAVLQVAERAEEVGRAGETAVERSLGGISEIGRRALEVGDQIERLSESARQIGGITLTVKDLADQSNMLALNAAIEAVRSGEHGKSFAVVAREIRSLADQSIKATGQVGEILSQLQQSIRAAVSISHQSNEGMEAGLVQVRASGTNLREIVGITRENVAAARQIAAAVSQQNLGIGHIFTAVTDQLRMMETVRGGLETTHRASDQLRAVAERLAGTLSRYRL